MRLLFWNAFSKFKDLKHVTFVRESKLCFNLFSLAYMANVCISMHDCRLYRRIENTLLHFPKSVDLENKNSITFFIVSIQ